MRIGIDLTALPRQPVGAGNYMLNLVRALADLNTGAQFVLFSPPHARKLFGEMPFKDWSWSPLPEQGLFRRLVWEQEGLPRLVKREQLDVLHSPHYTMPLAHPCRSVVTFHDMTFFLFPRLHTLPRRLFFPLAIRASASRADALLAVSESTRRDAIRLLHIPPEKITTTPLGVADNFSVIRDQAILDQIRGKYELPARFLLYVGLVEPRKNLSMLVSVYKRLIEQGIEHQLVVAGGFGWGVDDLFHQIDRLGLRQRIQFLGYVSQADLPMVYNLAEVFVYPSFYEGFGLPPLEAMACGTPVITTDVSSMPEHVGDAGVLVPAGNEDALADAIRAVVEDSKLRQDLKQRGPLRAAEYTWRRTAQTTFRVYQSLLA